MLEYKSLVGVDFGLLEFLHDDIPGYNGLLEYNNLAVGGSGSLEFL